MSLESYREFIEDQRLEPNFVQGRTDAFVVAREVGSTALLTAINHLAGYMPHDADSTNYIIGMTRAHTEITEQGVQL